MPKHKPIRFNPPPFSEEVKKYLERFMKRHPVASSTTKAVIGIALAD